MRIQHNIMAMGAYRNYTNNVNAMKKNLEKLSSGYKINRAGDDAAGLAISEKMRAQITGLETAQKNAKDGISLVQTAEGALTEVHDMLNRMVTLATQSANGTYDSSVDRVQLQKELNQLRSEIDRIADSSNFNGINLLDGSKAAKSTSALGASTAQMLSSMDGSAPSKAGAAEITLKLSNNAATASTVLDPQNPVDGTTPTAATKATLTITMGTADPISTPAALTFATGGNNLGADISNLAAATDNVSTVTVGGKTYTYSSAATDTDTTKFKDAADLKAKAAADKIDVDITNTAALTATAMDGLTMTFATAGGNEVGNNLTSLTSGTSTVTINGKTYTYDTSATGADAAKFKDADDLKAKAAADGVDLNITNTAALTATAKAVVTPNESVVEVKSGQEITVGMTAAEISALQYGANAADTLDSVFDIEIQDADGNAKDATTGTVAAGDKIVLTAKQAGAQSTAIDNAMANVANKTGAGNANSTISYVKGTDESYPGAPSSVTKYDLEIDLTKLRGGQRIEVGGKVIEFKTDGTASDTSTAGTATAPYIVNLKAPDAGTDGSNLDDIGVDLKAALNKIFETGTGKPFAASVSNTTAAGNFTYTVEGLNNTVIDQSNMGQIRLFDADTGVDVTEDADSAFIKSDYTPAAKDGTTPTPTPFASVEYELTADQIKAGNKITIGGKTIELVDNANDVDLANGKVLESKVSDATEGIAAALEQMKYTGGKVNVTTAGTGADAVTTIKITGVTSGEKAADLAKDAGKVTFLDATSAPASKVTVANGMTIEAGQTDISAIKDAEMPGGKKLSELFNITVNGNVQADSYKIKEGDEIKFTAKNNGAFDKEVMDKFKFTGKLDSLTAKNGWDEGSNASGDKTHYELSIDMTKVAGGNSFTFGNVNGQSYTFDLSFDPNGTKNDTIGADKKDDVAGNSERTVLNLYGKSTSEAQEYIYEQVKDKMGAAGFDVTRAISGNKVTLLVDAQEEGAQYNLGNIRTSSASGAFDGKVYNPAGGNAGGTPGTMAQVTYKFDVSQLQAGDVLEIGGTSITFGDETKKETVDGNVKFTVSVEDANLNPNKAIVETLESAGYKSGQVKFDTTNNTVTITGIATGETAADLQNAGAKISLTNASRSMDEGGLKLQIGDTADSFNQLTVSIQDMHSTSLGIGSISILNEKDAAAAIDVIKAAINTVSDVRGTLGATQNRLDHTINNLSVMQENIQDAESTIRDTDVASEMMAYTKNNILIQSAQAMLAQANQVPQGVLQLLG